MPSVPKTYYSIIFPNFQQPLVQIVFNLTRTQRPGTDYKSNDHDLDWVLSGLLLTAVMFECALRWTHLHCFAGVRHEGPKLYDHLRSSRPALPDVGEVFLLRNVIAHGHAWEVTIPRQGGFFNAFRRHGRDDELWKRYATTDPKKSRSGFNLVPSLMNRADLRRALDFVVAAMTAMVAEGILVSEPFDAGLEWPDGSNDRISFLDLSAKIT